MSRARYRLFSLILALVSLSVPTIGVCKADAPLNLSAAWHLYVVENAAREPNYRFPHERCFRRAASTHKLPITLLLAVARGESDFDPQAVSAANALGLMQILWPGTAHHLGIHRRSDLFDPCINVDAGARYLKELLQRYRGDLHRTLAAYNYGPSRVPVTGSAIPKGANWYSGYIYRHLTFVLGKSKPIRVATSKAEYNATGKLQLLTFHAPYHAAAFVANVQKSAPGVRLDWFRDNERSFRVVMMYENPQELIRGRHLLEEAGFHVR